MNTFLEVLDLIIKDLATELCWVYEYGNHLYVFLFQKRDV